MKRPDLQKLLKKWQARLRLQDWKITIKYVSYEDTWNQAYGRCDVHMQCKRARIVIRDPSEAYEKHHTQEYIFKDVEDSVLHELLHVWTTLIDSREDKNAIEHCTRALTEALLYNRPPQ